MASIAEPFAHGTSFVHRMDPRVRLLCAVLLTIPTALFQSLSASMAAGSIAVLVAVTAELPFALLMRRLLAVNVFIAFLWLFLPFSTPGTPLTTIGPLAPTREGLDLALLITVKSNSIVLALAALLGTIRVQDLGPALQQLRVPEKLCHILLFTYRYIFVIYQEYTIMRQAMAARGFKPKTNGHTYRSYAWLVGMLLIKSWDRAERVHGAMRCRGFKGRFYTLTRFKTRIADIFFLLLCALSAAVPCAMELMHRGWI